ncbi:ROK family transcriptional regulator [Streptomyces paludis]|uniref:ROK family transcriptional regulator n=1 Tax=Streptomyces paludis TaxID=2282738 RepID=A0A345HR29_9ACTN|nr:ROK family transcriptional regulator [Streptomyces paludis]AXG79153.1 ROK family transcriptional regulator [Streptomyces paludis]
MLAASWAPLSPAERAVAIEVLTHGPVSRTEIARKLNLSAGSLTRLTKPLIESGLLIEEPAPVPAATATRQGRPSQPLDIVADSRYFAGFKITADTVYGVVTTLRSEVVAQRTVPLRTRDPEDVADLLEELTRDFRAEFPRLAGIGVGIGGQVERFARAVASRFLGWQDVPFAELVERRTGLPVVVENDVAALVEAEAWFGAGRGLDRFAVLTIGAGIGYGLVIGGRLVRSADDGRGIGRRWIVNPYGPLTPDGERGSAVSLLTVPNIRYQVAAGTGRDHTYEEILTLAAAGDPLASRVMDEAAHALGTVVAQIANFAMPEKILLAGEGIGLMDIASERVWSTVRANRDPLAEPVVLETKVSDFNDWARGAAVLAIQILVLGRPRE